MEPDVCPPYVPSLIWWILHHPHGPGPDPAPDKVLISRVNSYFAAVAVTALSSQLADAEVGREVSRQVAKLASAPMPVLAVTR